MAAKIRAHGLNDVPVTARCQFLLGQLRDGSIGLGVEIPFSGKVYEEKDVCS